MRIPDRSKRTLLLAATLSIASGCIVYQSPRCLFDKGEGLAILSVFFRPQKGTVLTTSYWRDGYVDTLADADGLFCRRFGAETRQRMTAVLDRSRVAVDREVSFQDALRRGNPGRLFIYATVHAETARSELVWWGTELEVQPGHVERLDEIFCVLEQELSLLRRTVQKHGSEFLAARGRELPCGASSGRRLTSRE